MNIQMHRGTHTEAVAVFENSVFVYRLSCSDSIPNLRRAVSEFNVALEVCALCVFDTAPGRLAHSEPKADTNFVAMLTNVM